MKSNDEASSPSSVDPGKDLVRVVIKGKDGTTRTQMLPRERVDAMKRLSQAKQVRIRFSSL